MSESISQLPAATQANATDLIPATQASIGPGTGTTRAVTQAQLIAVGGTVTSNITLDAGGGWSSNNVGKQLLVTTPTGVSNPGIGITDSNGANLWGVWNNAGVLNLSVMPAYSNNATGPTNIASLSSAGIAVTGTLSTSGVLQMPNTTPIQMKDTGGTYRNAMFLSAANAMTLVNAGGGSFLVQNQAQNTSLLVCDNSGNFIVTGFQTINGTTTQTITGWEMNNGGTGAVIGTSRTVSLQCPNGSIVGVTVDANSDKRIKSDIQEITPTDGEAFVMSAKPSTYVLNGSKQSGFIAQDMVRAGYSHIVGSTAREGLPELVEDGLTSKADVLLTLSYNDTIAYLAAALKSAFVRIDALEAKPQTP